MQLIKIKKEVVDGCFKKGLVKPNEFKSIVDEYVHKELYNRYEYFQNKNITFQFLRDLFSGNIIEKYYQDLCPIQKELPAQILELAKNNPEYLLIDPIDCKTLVVAKKFFDAAILVRNCGDMFESEMVDGQELLVDKETLRAVDYLLKFKNSAYELLNN